MTSLHRERSPLQTFGFMLYVLGLVSLALALRVKSLVLASWLMSLALALPSVSLTPSLNFGAPLLLPQENDYDNMVQCAGGE